MARRERGGGRRGAARHASGKPHGGGTHGGGKHGGGKHGKPAHGRQALGKRPMASQPAAARKSPPPAPARAHTKLPDVVVAATGLPRAGEWLFTTRPGADTDLIEELYYADPKSAPHPVAPSLVAARLRPGQPAFARQAFPVHAVVETAQLGDAVTAALMHSGAPQPWALDIWVPDSDEGNLLAARAAALVPTLRTTSAWNDKRVADARAALSENGLYAQACLLPPGDRVAVGVVPARDAPSLAPGGRLRVHVAEAAPSRAAMKLAEAFLWLDRAPDPGDLCVDLGAAPGGWTYVLLERRARVIAVDPAFLARSLQGKRGVEHLRRDAFKYEPPEPVDWLFSDMAWRPLESAALLAKWARRGWARMLIANIKLPMRKKAEMLVRVREILEDGGWRNLRVRQLYHDREEVTVAGVRLA
ncbi:MAG TPA: 23S rRNA (cytidine(2498)-2'-O)-methyltransferase RlmM [Polyangia bacterium]|nr:23S rRNA (cytidine(2498)-2'-O)-methyltransferase RlmM [Polyangia bacterium]